jgi:hypothetical protein
MGLNAVTNRLACISKSFNLADKDRILLDNSISKMTCSLSRHFKSQETATEPIEHRTDWNSIYIVAIVAFIGSVHTHCISPAVWVINCT